MPKIRHSLTATEVITACNLFKEDGFDTYEIAVMFRASGLPMATEADIYNAISAAREQARVGE